MSLLDDARQLAEISTYCDSCTGSPISGHLDGCPLPRIAAALEAAERLTAKRASCYYQTPDEDDEPMTAFDTAPSCYTFCHGSSEHKPDCPWQALVSALRGGAPA